MSLWSRAADIARQTPPTRNRLVDFLRAASILAVISGHWLLAAPYVSESGFAIGNMLELTSYTKWLSWGFQVMPVFFLVGGYANAVSWRAAMRDGKPYGIWLESRLRRLILPVLSLIAAWAALATVARLIGIDPALVQGASKIAVIPVWFLAIYTVIVLLVPLTHAAWARWGFVSFLVPVALAVADDFLFFAGFNFLGWFNYIFIWVAVHQLGFAWLDTRLPSPAVRLGFGVFGLGLLYGLTVLGPYPIAMISVPDEAISNTLPPKLPLLALGIAQAGLVLSAEAPLRRWLQRPPPWTAAVLLNGMIMTIYLWHSTAMIVVMGLAIALGNFGLAAEPATLGWWALRPLWMLAYLAVLAAMMPLVARFERSRGNPDPPGALRQVLGSLLACFGLALLALNGLGGNVSLWLQAAAVILPFAGARVGGLLLWGRPATDA